jgi:hypothetical protein
MNEIADEKLKSRKWLWIGLSATTFHYGLHCLASGEVVPVFSNSSPLRLFTPLVGMNLLIFFLVMSMLLFPLGAISILLPILGQYLRWRTYPLRSHGAPYSSQGFRQLLFAIPLAVPLGSITSYFLVVSFFVALATMLSDTQSLWNRQCWKSEPFDWSVIAIDLMILINLGLIGQLVDASQILDFQKSDSDWS